MVDTPPPSQTQCSGAGGGSKPKEGDDSTSLTSSTHPMRQGWWVPLLCVQGTWLTPRNAKSVQLVQAELKPRPDDVLLATFPKSGTTWLKALAFALNNRSRYPVLIPPVVTGGGGDAGKTNNHPLLHSNPHDLVPFLELPDRTLRPVAELEALPSPRLLCTHLPPALLPPGMLSSCRAVYLCREPKDAFVSLWHHNQTACRPAVGDFDEAFALFCEGVSPYGPVWEHYLEYRKLSKRNPSRVLFLKYEEMMAQPAKHVRKLAEFLGVPFTEEEESSGVVEEVVRLCSFQNLKNLAVNTHGVSIQIGTGIVDPAKNSLWFRSGKVGDWENHLTREMAHRLDCVVQEKLKGSGLTF